MRNKALLLQDKNRTALKGRSTTESNKDLARRLEAAGRNLKLLCSLLERATRLAESLEQRYGKLMRELAGGSVPPTIRERRRIRDGRVEKDVEIAGPGQVPERWTESVALYDRDDLGAMLTAAGFSLRGTYGDLDGGPWSPASPRVVVRAEAS